MEELLTRSDLKGKISLLYEMEDTMGFMLKIVGADPADFTDDQFGRRWTSSRSTSTPARSVASRATTTCVTSSRGTSSPARHGQAT